MNKKVLIFGGSGFIGTALCKNLIDQNYHVCVICTKSKPEISKYRNSKSLQIKNIDIFNKAEMQSIIKDYPIIINLIGKLFEAQQGDFEKFHYTLPKLIAELITKEQHLIHISALGIENAAKTSLYAKTKLEAQDFIAKNCANYNIIKPSIVFGEQDNFFNLFANMAKRSPFLPLIGGGKTKFSPVYVKDLANSIIYLIENNEQHKNKIYAAYGPEIASFKELLVFILKTINKKRLLILLPFTIAKIEAYLMNLIKIYLLTPDQVELLHYDNIADNIYPNIDTLIGKLQSYKNIVPNYLK